MQVAHSSRRDSRLPACPLSHLQSWLRKSTVISAANALFDMAQSCGCFEMVYLYWQRQGVTRAWQSCPQFLSSKVKQDSGQRVPETERPPEL